MYKIYLDLLTIWNKLINCTSYTNNTDKATKFYYCFTQTSKIKGDTYAFRLLPVATQTDFFTK